MLPAGTEWSGAVAIDAVATVQRPTIGPNFTRSTLLDVRLELHPVGRSEESCHAD
jgi:hypothetical protein